MIICACAFTKKGRLLLDKLIDSFPDFQWILKEAESDMSLWLSDCFSKRLPVIFVSACGIAVRLTAPFVNDKLSDSPVLVMDENGRFIIPLLSGHVGGANELAELISKKTGSTPVITTATDVNGKFSADVFARKNGLRIMNREGIKKVSSAVLEMDETEKIIVWIDSEYEVEDTGLFSQLKIVRSLDVPEFAHIFITDRLLPSEWEGKRFLLWLNPRCLCVGAGCRKGKTFEELRDFLKKTLKAFYDAAGIDKSEEELLENVCSVSSINLKKQETGLMTLAQYLNVPFLTYSASELEKASAVDSAGNIVQFSESQFVKETAGISNVCERSAVLGAGNDCILLAKKVSENGMTFSIAKRKVRINI